MNQFLAFIGDISEELNKRGTVSWFDAKQETCHLLGIVNYILSDTLDKEVEVVNFHNVDANYEQDAFAEYFRSRAEEMVRNIYNG